MSKNGFCTFYIVRHGETDWNVQQRLQGQADIPMNDTGHKQAREAATKLAKVHFDGVFSSDLVRAKRTAEIIALEKKMAVETTRLLRERSFGKHEGKPNRATLIQLRKNINNYEKLSIAELAKVKLDKDVESDAEVVGRFLNFIRETAVAYAGKKVLAVTHGGLMRSFLLSLGFGGDLRDRYRLIISNTAYFVMESDGVEFEIGETEGIQINNKE